MDFVEQAEWRRIQAEVRIHHRDGVLRLLSDGEQ
jgi:hypothetical protein